MTGGSSWVRVGSQRCEWCEGWSAWAGANGARAGWRVFRSFFFPPVSLKAHSAAFGLSGRTAECQPGVGLCGVLEFRASSGFDGFGGLQTPAASKHVTWLDNPMHLEVSRQDIH